MQYMKVNDEFQLLNRIEWLHSWNFWNVKDFGNIFFEILLLKNIQIKFDISFLWPGPKRNDWDNFQFRKAPKLIKNIIKIDIFLLHLSGFSLLSFWRAQIILVLTERSLGDLVKWIVNVLTRKPPKSWLLVPLENTLKELY